MPQSAGDGGTPDGTFPPQAGQPRSDLTPAAAAGRDPTNTAGVAGTALPPWLIVVTAALIALMIAAGLALRARNGDQEPAADSLSILDSQDLPTLELG